MTEATETPMCAWDLASQSSPKDGAPLQLDLSIGSTEDLESTCGGRGGAVEPEDQQHAPPGGCIVSLSGNGFAAAGVTKGAVLAFGVSSPGATPAEAASLWHIVANHL